MLYDSSHFIKSSRNSLLCILYNIICNVKCIGNIFLDYLNIRTSKTEENMCNAIVNKFSQSFKKCLRLRMLFCYNSFIPYFVASSYIIIVYKVLFRFIIPLK